MAHPDGAAYLHYWDSSQAKWVPQGAATAAAGSTQVAVSNFPATQPVSGTVSVSGYVAPSTTVAISSVAGTVRAWVPASTYVSGQASSAGDNILISSVAAQSAYVFALTFSPISTAAQLIRLLNGSTQEMWRTRILAPSTVGQQAYPCQLSVTPPAYLFRSAAATPVLLNITSSGVGYALSFWRE